jgi:ankyrin repeat protein
VNCGEDIDSKKSIVGQAPIHQAVLSEKEDSEKKMALLSILKSNADANITDSNGWSPLHHAAFNGDLLSVNILKENGANINAFSNQFKTPLHFAALNNHPAIIASLLEGGAQIEAKDE